VRWAVLAMVLLILVGFPILYLQMYPNLGPVQRAIPPVTFTALLLLWTLGRPALIVAKSRRILPQTGEVGVSVVIPCCNCAQEVSRTVASILTQRRAGPLEVLLVENNSTDDTWAVLLALEAEFTEVRALQVTTRPEEYAASVAVNHGVAHASHEVIVRMDDDTLMQPGFLEHAVVPMASDVEVSATAVNLRVLNPDASLWTRFQSVEYLLAMELERRFQALFNSVLICSGGLSVFRRAVLIKSGGFCSLPKWVSEDMDITAKAHRFGMVRMVPEAIGFTEVPSTLRGLLHQRYRWAISGTVSMYLHREGLARSSYWYEGMIGFMGLPVRAAGALRDLFGFLMPVYLVVLWVTTGWWVLAVIVGWVGVLLAQLALLRPTLRNTQGLKNWWVVPLFPVCYGPLLLATRCAGTWAGLRHVRQLRRKEFDLQYEGGLLRANALNVGKVGDTRSPAVQSWAG
jgi:poly-beta-1,6-N-acetyl-D-glucosamine synthase